MKSPLASSLSRRVVLKAAGGVGLALACGEGAVPLLVDDPLSPYPLDTDGDDEMSQPASVYSKLYDPLILYASVTVSTGAGSGPNVAALMNPHGMPMELLEVRFRIYPESDETDLFEGMTGMGVGVKMDLGDIPIVDADVPLSAFGTARDDSESIENQIWPDPAVTTVTVAPYSYRWRLKYPLTVPAGCVVTPLFTHLGQTHFPVHVDVIYVCRTLPQNYVMPASFRVPWVGSYNSVSFDNLASQPAGRDFSSELDIVNPFRQPLELARLTGRCTAVFTSSDGSQQNIETNNLFRYQLGKLRIRSRSGDEIARNATPFNGLFPYNWRVWDVPGGWTMRPGEFYKVGLTVAATSATAPADDAVGSVQFAVGAVGYRQLSQSVFVAASAGGAS